MVKFQKARYSATEKNPAFGDHLPEAGARVPYLCKRAEVLLPPLVKLDCLFTMAKRAVSLDGVVVVEVISTLLLDIFGRA